MNYLISVIVPVYNVEKYIERCLRSLFSQTIAEKCQFIIINDCSPDNSLDIINKIILQYQNLRDNILIVNKSKNEGLSAARNTGLEVALGKYVIHIDSDDWCDVDMLENMSNLAEANSLDIVNCDMFFEYKNKSIIVSQNPGATPIQAVSNLLNGKYGAFLPIKLVKRSLYSNNKIAPDISISMWEDLNLSVPLYYYATSIGYINKPYFHYERSNNNSICNNISPKYVEQLFSAVDSKINFLNEKAPRIFDADIMRLKKRAKCFLFVQIDILQIKKYKDKYQEINKGLMKDNPAPIHNKIITYLLCNHFFVIGQFLLFILNLVRKIKK